MIIGHPGWGETLFLKDVFPRARQVSYAELYFSDQVGNGNFDPEFGLWTAEEQQYFTARNATLALAYAQADQVVAPTPYQAGLLPKVFRAEVLHEGVDTDQITPRPGARFTLDDGREIDGPLITFVSRRLEPLRGYHIFLRALPKLLAAVPEAQVLIIGSEGGGYGLRRPRGEGWTEELWPPVRDGLEASRVHFAGRLAHERMIAALQASAAHVYLTYPYVLSWSLLEAMAAGALVVASDTAPVRDVITDGVNGVLTDFFDVEALADHLIAACRAPERFAPVRAAARRTVVERYDARRVCLPAWLALIDEAG